MHATFQIVVVLAFDTNIDTLYKYAKLGVNGIRLNLIGQDMQNVLDSKEQEAILSKNAKVLFGF